MTNKEQCKLDEFGIDINFSKYFEKNLSGMLKILSKRRKERIKCLK